MVKVESDTSEAEVICSIPCFVCILLLFGLGLDETIAVLNK